MSDDRDDEKSEHTPDDTATDAPEVPPGAPDLDALGFDPQEVMRDPLGAVFKIMSDPNAMQAFESFLSSPVAQQMLGQGLDNPMIKQMVDNNPMLKSMMSQAASQGVDLSQGIDPSMLVGRRPQAAPPAPAAADPEPVEEVLDEPRVALLDPPVPGTPAFPDPAPVASLSALLELLPEGARRDVAALADKRVAHHLGADGLERLGVLASQRGAAQSVDLLVCQGAFAGELAWYAICTLEEAHGADTFAPLAHHALQCVTFNCGYRVPSFVTQLVQYLLDVGALREQDLRHATWALSGQPRDGESGVFEVDFDQLEELAAGLGDTSLDRSLQAAFLVAVLGWRELDLSERPAPVVAFFDTLTEAQREAVSAMLLDLIEDGREVQSLRIHHLSGPLQAAVAQWLVGNIGLGAVLDKALHARFGVPWALHRALLESLDVLWNDARDEVRTAYLDKLLAAEDDGVRRHGYRVAAAWAPHTYLERAAQDPSSEIRAWAEDEAKALR